METTVLTPISPHLAEFLTPLSEATAQLLVADNKLYATDRLHVGIVESFNSLRRFTLTAKISTDTHGNPYGYRLSEWSQYRWWQRIPGASVNMAQVGCTAPLTDTTVLCTLAAWGKDRISFEDEITRLEFWTRFGDFIRNQKVTQYQAEFKQNKTVPDRAPKGPDYRPFMPHQRVASLCLCESEAYALFMEMRTGKSGAFIGAMDYDSVENPNRMHLIVCPKNVRTNWLNEIKSFTTKNVHIVVLRGNKIDRIKALLTAFEYRNSYDYTVVLSSYEGLVGTLSQVCAFQWRWCALDESHYFKSPLTQRWKAVHKLRECCEKRTSLTGTPICNTAFDLYTQFEWLGEGHCGFSSREEFRRFYGTWEVVGRGFERLVGMRNLPLLQERLTRSSFIISKKEALPDLPPVTHTILECEMTDHQKAIYIKLATVLYAEIERELGSTQMHGTVTVNNILTKLLRLAQVTSGFVSLDGEVNIDTGDVITRELDRFDPNPKLDLLIDRIKESDSESKVIVWACFVPNIKQIAARLELEGIKCVTFYGATKDDARDVAVYAFNNDASVKVFVSNPAAGGVGINLSGSCDYIDSEGKEQHWTQCDTMIYYSQGWSSPVRIQSSARPQSKKCNWSVEIIDLIVMDTIDYEILNRLLDKATHAMEIQDIKVLLGRLIKK